MISNIPKLSTTLASFVLSALMTTGIGTLVASPASAQQVAGPASAGARPVYVSPSILQALGDPRKDTGLALQEAAAAPTVRVIVSFASRNTLQSQALNASASAEAIRDTRSAVLGSLPPTSFSVVSTFEKLSAVSLLINREALDALLKNPEVTAVNEDSVVKLHMAEANALTGANTIHNLAPTPYTGAGVRAGIIDTGIDSDHPGLQNDLIFQRCFRTEGDCPNGNNVNSAEDQHGHGTHVAGIITGPLGVAPSVKFAALKVFTTGNTSDTNILNALDYVINNNATLQLDYINMSLGSSNYATRAACDAASTPYVTAFSTLNAMGIGVFVSTGNDASTNSVGSPGCATGAIGVGSSGDATFTLNFSACTDNGAADKISCFSNTTPNQGTDRLVDLVAPGCSIISTGLNGSTTTMMCGTSMATPYALGVGALAREYANTHSIPMPPAALETLLRDTGVAVSDYRLPAASPTFPRVSPLRAIGALSMAVPTGFTITGTTTSTVSSSWNAAAGATQYRVYRSANAGAFTLAGTVTAPTTTFVDNAAPCGNLSYYVKAVANGLESQPSNTDSNIARTCPATPNPLVLTPASATTLSLQWADNSTDETGFLVERSLNGDAFQTLANLAANTTSTSDNGLSCGQQYDYRVAAVRGADQSPYTNIVGFHACAPANDEYATATVIATPPNTYAATVANAQYASLAATDPQHSCAFDGPRAGTHTLWWTYTPPFNGRINLNTLLSSGGFTDTLLSVYTGTLGAFTEVACNDDVSQANMRSQLTNVPVTGNTTYTIYVSRWQSSPTATASNLMLNLTYTPTPAVIVAPTSVSVAEGGAGASYSVVLTSLPQANVVVTASPDSQLTASPSVLTFTTANWNVAQTVTVNAVDDAVVEGNHTGTISHSVSSSDTSYNGLVVNSVTANITDNDLPTFTVTGSAAPSIGGSVSCVPTTVVQGNSATCTATANTGFTFSNWSGDCSGAGACVLANVTANRSVTANFAPVLSMTIPTATGTGNATFTIDGAAGCRIEQAGFVPAPLPAPTQGTEFPHGLVSFVLGGCTPGASAQVTLTLPQSVQGMQYWKRLVDASWLSMPATLSGNTVTFSIQDNGAFDLDATPGVIRDPSGPGAQAAAPVPVPGLSREALLLVGLLLLSAVWYLRRKNS